VPRDLETICLKCLHKEPGQRYATAEALAEDLRRYQAGEPIEARPAGLVERGAKWVRRRPTTAALLTVSLLAGVTLLGGGLYFTSELARERDEVKKQKDAADDQKTLAETRTAEVLAEKKKVEEERDRATFQALRADTARHAIQIDHALRSWERHDVTDVERVLGEVAKPFQQTWEVCHLRGLCRRKALPLLGHTYVTSVAFSPDGRRIASASGDHLNRNQPGELKVWDARTGKELLGLRGHTGEVLSVCFSADGRRLASGGEDQTVRVWDALTGQELLALKAHTASVRSVCFSPDGTRVASAGGGGVKVWDAQSGQETLTLRSRTGGILSVCLSPDGRRIASGGSDNTVRVWDVQTGQEVLTLKGHTGWVNCVAFSPDGTRIASASQDKSVRLWEAPAQ
jgi:hypothetical protein